MTQEKWIAGEYSADCKFSDKDIRTVNGKPIAICFDKDTAEKIARTVNVHEELIDELSKARLLLKLGIGKNDILNQDAVMRISIILSKEGRKI